MSIYSFLKKKILSVRAAAENNSYVVSHYNEMIREMEGADINSSTPITEIKGWLLRQSDGFLYHIKNASKTRLKHEASEPYLFRIRCKQALAQLERDGVIRITTQEEREAVQ